MKNAIPTEFLPDKKRGLNTDTNARYQRREEIKNRKAIIGTILDEVTEEVEDVSDKITDKMEYIIHQEDASSSESSIISSVSEL